MKLHSLTMKAFGPFADVATIDFDGLGADGLFLIAGPTGAGKTTILDAVSFALYGRVPGQRNDAHELRTQGVAPDRETRVALTFTSRGRTYRVERSPAYERAALRGGGTTVQRASAALFELKSGEWGGLSRTNQEVSSLVQDAIGLTADQFTKIIMLPQGQFAQFLKAGPQEREPILQQLFDTARFARVERILAEDATLARAQVARISEARNTLVAAALDNAGLERGALALPTPPTAADVLAGFAVALDEVRQRAEAHGAAAAWARSAAGSAAEDLRAAEQRVADAARLATLRAAEQRLAEGAEAVRTAELRLSEHDAALALAPALDEFERASSRGQQTAEALSHSSQALRRAARRAGITIAEGTETGADRAAADVIADSDVDAWLRGQSVADRLARDLAAAEHLRKRVAAAADAVERGGAARREAHAAQESSTAALNGLAPVELAEERVIQQSRTAEAAEAADRTARRLAAERDTARESLNAAKLAEDSAIAREQADRAAYDRTRELRLDALAAELAGLLEPGAPCPVCGATEHPNPTTASPADITKEAEREAREVWESGARTLRAATARRAAAAAALKLAESASEAADPDGTAAALREARERLDGLVHERDELRDRRSQLSQDVESATTRLSTAESELAAARQEQAAATAELAALERTSLEQGGKALGDLGLEAPDGAPDADALAEALGDLAEAGRLHLGAARARATAKAEADSRAARLAADIAESPFPDAAAVRRELAADVSAQRRLVSSAREDEIRTAHLAEDPAIARALKDPADPVELQRRATAADEALAAARARSEASANRAAVTADALERVLRERAEFLNGIAASERSLAADGQKVAIAGLVQATSPDNLKRMSLSSYALLAEFVQVAESASERLIGMTRGRYRLVHDISLHKREKRAGLGLMVADEFTQSLRDPRTLSGGESFMAALALALGLADTVAGSRGGIELDTLFIDEGFGSLDPDSLAEVLTVLDDLRAGGRTVGIISHVASMQDAIPSRLVVAPSPAGSTLSVAVIG